jgi:nucleotide-binding universal stress UspA family protein
VIAESSVQPRLVVGVDGSSHSLDALRWATDEARLRHAKIDAIYAWRPPYVGEAGGMAAASVTWADLAAAAQEVLDHAVDTVAAEAPDVSFERRCLEGPPALTLVEEAKDATMLVVGARGHGGFLGLLLGSVAHHVAHHAPCPVVVVPPPTDQR